MYVSRGSPTRRFGSWLGLAAVVALAASLGACSGSDGATGATGATGAQGPAGDPGAQGPAATVDISTATALTAEISSVTIASAPVVTFKVTDQNGAVLSGLTAYDSSKRIGVRFAIARLDAGTNGGASHWTSYYTRSVTSGTCPTGATCVTYPTGTGVTQAAIDSTGTLAFDAASGNYTYTFSKDITTDPAYSAAATHRVALQINGYAPANNGAFTFRPDGAKTMLTRDIVATATCNKCHERLAAHGGARVEVEYCAVCHSPQTTDYYSGNTVDLKVMIHKIHTGANLPSLVGQDPTKPDPTHGYWVGSSNFNLVLYPQDTRNCDTCHVTGAGAPNDAMNYTAVPTIEACGACHESINFATGAGHSTGNIVADDSMCATCHVNSSDSLKAANAHAIPEVVEAANYQYNINGVTFVADAGGTKYPAVNFTIANLTPGATKAYWNILADAPFIANDPGTGKPVCTSAARLSVDIGWETSDYTNWVSNWTVSGTSTANAAAFLTNLGVTTWGQPVQLNPIVPGAGSVPSTCSSSTLAYDAANVTPPSTYVPPAAPKVGTLYGPDGNGAFTVVGPALPAPPAATCADGNPCAAIQNIAVVLEGHPGVVEKGPGASRIPVKTALLYKNVGTGSPVARRQLVDIAKCDVCHKALSLHGSNRNDDTQVCVVCHNPASTDYGRRAALTGPGIDGLYERPIDFKYMIHGIHRGNFLGSAPPDGLGMPFVVYGFGGNYTDFTDVIFPAGNDVGNCNACHIKDASGNPTYMPGVDPFAQAMTTSTGLGVNFMLLPTPPTTGSPVSTSPTMAACTGCHQAPLEISHMLQNGGSAAVTKDAEGRMFPASNPAGVETCAVCHGAGALADVSKVHAIAP
jgi:hypothetical protein